MNVDIVILIDSDAFIALRKGDDSNHKKALLTFNKLKNRNISFIASNYVYSETITILSQKISHRNAVDFIDQKNNPSTFFSIIRLDEEIEETAISIFKKQTSKNVSFVDCANMALLETRQADMVWSFDKVYQKNGYKTV